MIKFLLVALFLSFSTFAADVDGTITYKLPNGKLVDRDVVLNVPARGQGEVVLSGKSFEWRTTQFATQEVAGQTIFTALFEVEFMGNKSLQLFKGTYFKGDNTIIYQGDVYKAKKSSGIFNHTGVFKFQYNR